MMLDDETLAELGYAHHDLWTPLAWSDGESVSVRRHGHGLRGGRINVADALDPSETLAEAARRLGVTYQAIQYHRAKCGLVGRQGSRKLTQAQIAEAIASSETSQALAARWGVAATTVHYHRAKSRGKDYAAEKRARDKARTEAA